MRSGEVAGVGHLLSADPAFSRIVAAAGPFNPRPPQGDYFNALVTAIAHQQLAGRAAAAIHGRFLKLFDGPPTPRAVLAHPAAAIRGAGMSGAKATSIRDLALRVEDGTVPLEKIEELTDSEIVERLSTVRGIGRWTAEMFLVFQLRRLDVWPVGDLAVRNGWGVIHATPAPAPKVLETLGEPLRPYRTVAAWYCWRATDTVLPDI